MAIKSSNVTARVEPEVKEQAEAMQAEYEKSLAGAKEEAARLLNQASQTAARNSEETLNAARNG